MYHKIVKEFHMSSNIAFSLLSPELGRSHSLTKCLALDHRSQTKMTAIFNSGAWINQTEEGRGGSLQSKKSYY
ncbi:hypothetical protein RRG08_059658 [Elysia crispata]|uniref:Uncharacterized protein n=1 Tax=Elysia crispata TaxID=231223 RepID=A0AAE1B4V7_9GAST|nr:hypothetical protein RRG08_059658 [Elysia crispata]